MKNNYDFDLWADSYDCSVKDSDESDEYPFAGYKSLMNAIYGQIMHESPVKIFDIGFGTATLTAKLYEGGNEITGIDFSKNMLEIAQEKMPNANLLNWDFTQGIPSSLANEKFDFIIATYSLHHLADEAKVDFILKLLDLLRPQGRILIGDICFQTRELLVQCKEEWKDYWDEEEIYPVFSELKSQLQPFCTLEFHEFSFCSGIIEIYR